MDAAGLPALLDAIRHLEGCAANFHQNGGYGEMSVLGVSVLCQHIASDAGTSFVFHRIQYCPASNPNCGQDGTGTFK